MPLKAQRQRIRPRRVVRGITAIGAGGAALALPLFGAAQANAAPAASAKSTGATAQAPSHQSPKAASNASAKSSYTVVSGDYLSMIAQEQDVDGGWKQLYSDNESVIGGNPDLIMPGMKLSLNGKAAGSSSSSAQSSGSTSESAPQTEAPKQEEAPEQEAPQAEAPKQEEAPQEEQAAAPAEEETSTTTAASTTTGGYSAPVDATRSTPYKASGGSWSSGSHTGVDFSAASGSTVKAVTDGTVVTAGWGGSYGNQIVIKHNDGTYSQYAHLSSISVSAGQSVGAGDAIGLSGSTGNSTGPHLHFEIRTGPDYGSDIDPVAYLAQHGVSV